LPKETPQDEALISEMIRSLQENLTWKTLLDPPYDVDEVKRLRALGRKAGRRMGRSVRTWASSPEQRAKQGYTWIYVFFTENTDEEMEGRQQRALEALERGMAASKASHSVGTAPRPNLTVVQEGKVTSEDYEARLRQALADAEANQKRAMAQWKDIDAHPMSHEYRNQMILVTLAGGRAMGLAAALGLLTGEDVVPDLDLEMH